MRRATAHMTLDQHDQAVADLAVALEFEPRNKECYAKLQAIVDIATSIQQRGNTISVELRKASIRAAMMVSIREGWTLCAVRGNPGPAAVNGHTLFTDHNGRIYLFGGRSVREQKPDLFVLDASDNTSWDIVPTRGATVPSSCAWHSTSVIGNEEKDIYCVYGGVSSRGEDASVYLLIPTSPREFQWIQAECAQDRNKVPLPRSGHAAVSVTDKNGDRAVFVFGGRTKRGVSDELLVLHLSSIQTESGTNLPIHGTVSWEQLGPRDQTDKASSRSAWPPARDGHSMCFLPSTGKQAPRLIVFGGNGQLNDDKKNDVWLFDLEKRRWTFLDCSGDSPAPRSYHTAHTIGEFLFIVFGRTATSEDDSVYMLEIEKAQWHKLPIPSKGNLRPRAWHSSVLTKAGNLFVLGGGALNGPLKDAAILDLSYFRLQAVSFAD